MERFFWGKWILYNSVSPMGNEKELIAEYVKKQGKEKE